MSDLILVELKDKIIDFCGDKQLFVFFEINGYNNFIARPFNFSMNLTAKDLPYTLGDLFELNKKVEETYNTLKSETRFIVNFSIFYDENIKIKFSKTFIIK
jgi:hypothetical protein